MTNRHALSLSQRTALFAGIAVIAALFLTLTMDSSAQADYAGLPTTWPEPANMKVTVSAGKDDGGGANQVISPSVWLKVYTKTRTAKTLSINFSGECTGNKRFLMYRTNPNESIKAESKQQLGADKGAGCGGHNITIPADMFANNKSNVVGHTDFYVSLLNIRITNDPIENGPRSFFRVHVDSGGAGLGSWGVYNSGNGSMLNEKITLDQLKTEAPRAMAFNVQGASNTIRYQFKPPCDLLGSGAPWGMSRDIYLDWSDDDRLGTVPAHLGTKKAWLSVYSPENRINMPRNYEENSPSNRFIKEFQWAGGGGNGYARFPIVDNKGYAVEFDKMTNGSPSSNNTLVIWYPFDSGDFNLDCPDPGWQLEPNSWESQKRVAIGFNYQDPEAAVAAMTKNPDESNANFNNRKNDKRNDVKKENRKSAAETLRGTQFNHYLTNKQPAGDREHITTPRAHADKAGCFDGINYNTRNSYCARTQQRVFTAEQWTSRGSTPDASSNPSWRWRFGDAGAGSEDITNNGFSRNITQGQTVLVNDGWEGSTWYSLPDSPSSTYPRHPATYNDNGDGPSNVDNWLKNVKPDNVYCERLTVRNGASYDSSRRDSRGGWGRCIMLFDCPANQTCVPPTDYELTPSMATDPSGKVDQGKPITPKPSVEKDPAGNPTNPTHWRVSRFVVPANADNNTLLKLGIMQSFENKNNTGEADACTWVLLATGITTCGANSEQGNRVFSSGTTSDFATNPDATATLAIGTQYCYIMSVKSWEYEASGWRHSRPSCVTVAKSPKVQFLNGDVRAGRGFEGHDMSGQESTQAGACVPNDSQKATIVTSGSSNSLDNRYGSWVEYGAFATGKIYGFGSAATPVGMSDYNKLTFGNNSSAASGFAAGGDFVFNNCMQNYFDWVDETKAQNVNSKANNLDARTLTGNASNQYVTSGRDVTLSDTAFGMTNSVILRIKKDDSGNGGDVTINGNLRFFNTPSLPYASFSVLPQLIIIADGDITINENVEQIDAWLITKGTIKTCGDNTTPNNSQCTKQLRINGPVSATRLELYRTHGADLSNATTAPQPAELFTLNPVHLLKRYAPSENGSTNPNSSILSEIELPPRY